MKNLLIIIAALAAMVFGYEYHTGTGVAVNSRYIATAYHVVNNDDYHCYFDQETKECYEVDVYAYDEEQDIAILKIKNVNVKLNACTLKPTEEFVGLEVSTVGYYRPFFNDMEKTIYTSRIRAADSYYGDSLIYRIKVKLDHGMSGGPSFNEAGYVIGISRSISTVEDNTSNIIKSTKVLEFMKQSHIVNIGHTENRDKCAVIVVSSEEKFEYQ